MLKRIIFIILPLVLLSCAKTNEELALEVYDHAKHSVEQGEWNNAKILIDSIHQQYAREVKVRRMADTLSWRIEMYENERTLVYIDSLLPSKQAEFEDLKKNFIYSKDEKYQDYGVFLHRSMSIGYNLERSYLKPSVDERGVLMVLSQYYGTTNVQHHSLQLESDNITYLTKDKGDFNSFGDEKLTAETLLFDHEEALAIGNFVKEHRGERIKVVLKGLRQYTYYLTETDKKAIDETLAFATVVYDCYRMGQEQRRLSQRNEQLRRRVLNL